MRLGFACALTFACAHVAAADPAPAVPPAKTITAAQVPPDAPIVLDGVLDDAVWRAATWTSDFVDKEPTYGATPQYPTEVAIAYDDQALYVGARMTAGPDGIDAGVTRRDDGTQAERIIISLDPFRSRHVAYSFAVTAGGTRLDWIHTDDDEHARDYSWDPVWEAKVARAPSGWTAEMRIPLGQLRYPRGGDAWGVDFNHYVPHRQEDIFWIAVPKDVNAWPSWFGTLAFPTPPAPARHLELIPYATLGADVLEAPTGQLQRHVRALGGAGLDLRAGLGPGLTLVATFNPDFGQVEADPAIVNLTAYEVTLPERRPFFIEGAQIFTSGHGYFYSRRIGGLPSLDLTYDEILPPPNARILGAVKITGRATTSTNVGALAAVTDAESAPVVVAGQKGELALAPLTGWGVARIEHELGGAGSTAGATITTVARDLSDPALAAQLARLAVTGGADLRLRPDHGRYEMHVHAGGSDVEGDAAAITRIQRLPAHYFQRPDQPHVHVDPNATALRGWHADVAAAKRAGTWLADAGFGAESPALELNDAGRLASADNVDWYTDVTRQVTTPSRHLHFWRLTASANGGWNFGGVRKPGDVSLDSSFTLPSFASTGGTLTAHYPGLLDDLTRGGPLMRDGAGASGSWWFDSTPNQPTTWGVGATATWSETSSRGGTLSGNLTAIISPRLRVQVAPRALWQRVVNQYVTTIAGGGADTYGSRYLFAMLEQHEVAAQLRAQLALSPDLALDAYVEPFASVGRYTGLGELAAARGSTIRRYDDFDRGGGSIHVRDGGDAFTVTDPDFTTVSLRSTVVLRWEIRPGSILYAVWQQNRGRTDSFADPSYRALGRPFTVPGEHVIAVKLSWWFAP